MKIRFEKRLEPSLALTYLNPVISFILGLLFCAIILKLAKINPISAYIAMFAGAFGSSYGFSETLVKTIPLLLCGLGVSFAFRMQLWNIGAEGQFYMGAMAASFIALYLLNQPTWVMLPLMLLAGFIAGGLWGLIAGILKTYFASNEVITTLMLNYIAIFWVDYLVYGPWKDPNGYGFPMTASFAEAAWLPCLGKTRIHLGFVIALLACALVWIIFCKTKWGYEIRVIGANPRAAEYAGISIARNIILVMLVSGGLAGLAGMCEVSGITHRLQHGISPGYGYTAIIIAWLAKLHPAAIILTAFIFGGILVGGDQLQISMGVPISFSYILQGSILFFILGGEILTQYKMNISLKSTTNLIPPSSSALKNHSH